MYQVLNNINECKNCSNKNKYNSCIATKCSIHDSWFTKKQTNIINKIKETIENEKLYVEDQMDLLKGMSVSDMWINQAYCNAKEISDFIDRLEAIIREEEKNDQKTSSPIS